MILTDHKNVEKQWWQLPNLWLLICLGSFFVVYPLLTELEAAGRTFDILLSCLIVLALVAQSNLSRRFWVFFLIVGFLALLGSWSPIKNQALQLATSAFFVIFFGFSIGIYCHKLFTEKVVDVDTLLAATCAYVLMGFFFSTLFAVLWQLDNSAIEFKSEEDTNFNMVYFSFVTLTTLGYGDVVPVSPSAKMLAVFEAIVGQVFVTIFVAELVGVHVANRTVDKPV